MRPATDAELATLRDYLKDPPRSDYWQHTGRDAFETLLARYDEHVGTAERFRERFRRAEAAIAKARKLMRLHMADVLPGAYEALDWRAR